MKTIKFKSNKKPTRSHSNKSKSTNILLNKPSISFIKLNNNNCKNTMVDICKIYNNINKNVLIGFTFSNCYGAKSYIKNKINHAKTFLYPTYIKNFKHNVSKNTDISYIEHTNAFNPITLVSTYPFEGNEYLLNESMQKTFIKFVEHLNGNPDPSNEGKVFLINYLPDYILDNIEKEKLFLNICKHSNFKII
jgi:hypothetical protein